MHGRILIIDTLPTNRGVLKAKMLAAHFTVESCASTAEAVKRINTSPPDLVLINLSDPVEARHGFCKTLRNAPATAGIGIVVIGLADTAMARFAALDAGADDVLPLPTNDTLLLARIRSLLRVRSNSREVAMHEAPGHALGFEEKKQSFVTASPVAILSRTRSQADPLMAKLSVGLRQKVSFVPLTTALADAKIAPLPDLMVIVAEPGDRFLDTVSDLRLQPDTGLAAQLIILPEQQPELAAAFLDNGADDVVSGDCEPRELVLRAKALLRRQRDRKWPGLKEASGVLAAITNPQARYMH